MAVSIDKQVRHKYVYILHIQSAHTSIHCALISPESQAQYQTQAVISMWHLFLVLLIPLLVLNWYGDGSLLKSC